MSEYGLLMTVYKTVSVFAALGFSFIADKINRVDGSIALAILSSIGLLYLSFVAPNITALLFPMIVCGIGLGGLMVFTTTLAGQETTLKTRPLYFLGFWGIGLIGGVIGTVIGGQLFDAFDYQIMILVFAAIMFISAGIAAAVRIKAPDPCRQSFAPGLWFLQRPLN